MLKAGKFDIVLRRRPSVGPTHADARAAERCNNRELRLSAGLAVEQDGSIRVAVGATGIIQTKAVKEKVPAAEDADRPPMATASTI
jgi:hypothetical protein